MNNYYKIYESKEESVNKFLNDIRYFANRKGGVVLGGVKFFVSPKGTLFCDVNFEEGNGRRIAEDLVKMNLVNLSNQISSLSEF